MSALDAVTSETLDIEAVAAVLRKWHGLKGVIEFKQAADELERLHSLEIKALIWSSFQDDDSVRDQVSDPHLKRRADDAAESLLCAL